MLSQAPSTRSIIMAVVIVAGLIFAAPQSGHAVPIDTTFEIKVEGMGVDMNGDPIVVPAGTLTVEFDGESGPTIPTILDITELDHIKLTWQPESGPVPSPPSFFSFESTDPLSDFNPAVFQYATPTHMTTPDTIILLDIASALLGMEGNGPRCQMSSADESQAPCVVGRHLFIQSGEGSATYPIVSAGPITQPPVVIPEPSTWLLLSTGLVGVIGYAFSRRVRPAAPRRTPSANA